MFVLFMCGRIESMKEWVFPPFCLIDYVVCLFVSTVFESLFPLYWLRKKCRVSTCENVSMSGRPIFF